MKEIENLLAEHGVAKDKASEFIEIYDVGFKTGSSCLVVSPFIASLPTSERP